MRFYYKTSVRVLHRSFLLLSYVLCLKCSVCQKTSDQRRFLRARLLVESGKTLVRLTGIQNNSALKSMMECNLFVDVPAGSGPLSPGELVSALIVGNIDNTDEYP